MYFWRGLPSIRVFFAILSTVNVSCARVMINKKGSKFELLLLTEPIISVVKSLKPSCYLAFGVLTMKILPGTSVESFLRSWIGVVGFMALGNTVHCFISGTTTVERLYAGSEGQVTSLTVRLFGIWTFLAAILRITCALYIHNNQIYFLTLGSFVLVFMHFISELLIFQSAVFSVEIVSPLAISGASIILMIIGRWFLGHRKIKRK